MNQDSQKEINDLIMFSLELINETIKNINTNITDFEKRIKSLEGEI